MRNGEACAVAHHLGTATTLILAVLLCKCNCMTGIVSQTLPKSPCTPYDLPSRHAESQGLTFERASLFGQSGHGALPSTPGLLPSDALLKKKCQICLSELFSAIVWKKHVNLVP